MHPNAGRGRSTRSGGDGAMPRDVSKQRGWRPARHVVDPASAKLPTRRVTIDLDEELVAIFKAEALRGGPPYLVAINRALRSYLHGREMSEQDWAVQVVMTALADEAVQRKVRSTR